MGAPGAGRSAVLAREARRLDGNRLWRIETPAGPLLQKYYVEKAGALRLRWRSLWSRILRGATGASAEERCRVEGETLAVWRAAGVDVPADRTAEFPSLAGARVRLLEWIEGRPLSEVLAGGGLAPGERAALLRRAGAAWGGRLAEAARRGDARLVQFHGGFMHLLVAGERLVAIDLEQAYLPGRAVAPRIAREVASCVRGLARGREEGALLADLEALASGVPDRALLADAAEAALRRPLDPRRARTAPPLRLLVRALRAAPGAAGV